MFNQETIQLFLSIMFRRLDVLCKNLEFSDNKKLMSRWGMSNNQLIRANNSGNEAIMEQMQNIQLLQQGRTTEEPKDVMSMFKDLMVQAEPKKTLTFDPVKDLGSRVDGMESILNKIAKKVGV